MKITQSAAYAHVSAIPQMREMSIFRHEYMQLRRMFKNDVGGANVFKRTDDRNWSFLWYPSFDTEGHPVLLRSFTIRRLVGDKCVGRERMYKQDTAPVLHRKELFVAPNHPLHDVFERLTRLERKHGLLQHPVPGRNHAWKDRLKKMGFEVVGNLLFQGQREVTK